MGCKLGVARCQALEERAELRCRRAGRPGVAQQVVDSVEGLCAARDAGQLTHGALERVGQSAGASQLVQVDVVVVVHESQRPVCEDWVDAQVQQGLVGHDAAADELPRRES